MTVKDEVHGSQTLVLGQPQLGTDDFDSGRGHEIGCAADAVGPADQPVRFRSTQLIAAVERDAANIKSLDAQRLLRRVIGKPVLMVEHALFCPKGKPPGDW